MILWKLGCVIFVITFNRFRTFFTYIHSKAVISVDKSLPKKPRILILLLIAAGLSLTTGAHQAEANYFSDIYNNFQQFTELPKEIDELKDSYQETLDALEQARVDAEMYREQNAELMEQNRQLSETVNQLKEAEEARNQNNNKYKTIALTAAALLAGYFILTRALRFGMKRTNRSRL